MPQTIELLNSYPEGPERERAFKLVVAATTEVAILIDKENQNTLERFANLLSSAMPSLADYLKRGK